MSAFSDSGTRLMTAEIARKATRASRIRRLKRSVVEDIETAVLAGVFSAEVPDSALSAEAVKTLKDEGYEVFGSPAGGWLIKWG